MTTFRGSTLRAAHGIPEVLEQTLPETPAGGLRIKVELAGVCATDLHIAEGHIPGFTFPVTLGHEVCGVVDEVGRDFGTDVRGKVVNVGDRVAIMPATPCGHCAPCLQAGPYPTCENWDVIGFSNPDVRGGGGGWGQYVACGPRTRVFVTDAPPEVAVLAEPAATPVEGLMRAGFRLGDSVLVQGTGTVGLLAIAVAIVGGADRVVVIGGPPKRLGLALGLGASHVVDIGELREPSARKDTVLAASRGGEGFDIVVECAGVPSTIPEGLGYLRRGGVFVELGHFSDVGTVPLNPYQDILARDARLVSSSGYTPDSFGRALGVVERLGQQAADLITHRLPMSRAGEALHALTAAAGWTLDGDEVGKLVIDPWL